MTDNLGIRTHRVEIEGLVFFIRKFEPFMGLRYSMDLQSKVIGPISRATAQNPLTENALNQLVSGVAGLSDALKPEVAAPLFEKFLDPNYISIEVNGETRRLDMAMVNLHIEGPEVLFLLFMEVVKFNFGGFTKLFKSRFGGGQQLMDTLRRLGSAPLANSGETSPPKP